jgi:hypothetical protein
MPRQLRIVALSIWPGLAPFGSGQDVLALLLGEFFASVLNLAVVTRWIWLETFPQGWSDFFMTLAVVTWLASLTYTLWWVGFCHPDRHRSEIDRLFREARRPPFRTVGSTSGGGSSGSWRSTSPMPARSCT